MEPASAALSTPELVAGRYRPLRPLGSGSSGSVWLARDENSGLEVALKVVPREGRVAARAEREAGVAARLRHPNCQRIYERTADQGHIYIAYEYVPGCTLREAMRAGRLSDRDAVEAAAQILDGLAHAHAKGIVHRDVKPANVLLADEPEISVRLLDFGLAVFDRADTLTAVGDVPGTLAYISPERLRGDEAGPASDVWAVGVLLWEALAGRHPFWAASLPATAKKIGAGAPPLEQVRPDLPRSVLQAVNQALQSTPARRPPATDLAQRLRAAAKRRTAPPKRRRRPPAPPVEAAVASARLLPAALAALFAGWTSATIPFYPGATPVALALAAGIATLLRPRVGLAVALAVPVLPLGNASQGLALLYLALAAAWFVLHRREPGSGLAFAAGPLLAPLALLGALPLVLQPVRGTVRRGLHGALAVLLAGVAAGLRGADLPFTGGPAPKLDLHETGSPFTAASALLHALGARPGLLIAALVLGGAAAACPFAIRAGLWGIAGLGAAIMAGLLVGAPHASPVPVVVSAWLVAAILLLQERGWNPLAATVARLRSATAHLGFE